MKRAIRVLTVTFIVGISVALLFGKLAQDYYAVRIAAVGDSEGHKVIAFTWLIAVVGVVLLTVDLALLIESRDAKRSR